MKKVAFIIIVALFVGLIGYKVVVKIGQNRDLSEEVQGRRGQRAGSIPVVKVQPVKVGKVSESLDLVGTIIPETEVAIQPMVSGRLLVFPIEEGQYVRAGAVVGEIDAETLRVQLQQTLANLAQIRSSVQQAQINVGKLKLERDRYRELLSKKYVSQSEYDAAEAAYQSAVAALEGVRAQLTSAEKNHDLLQIQMRNTRIISPISGYILKKFATAGSNLTTGSTVATVVPLNQVKLSFRVDQTQAAKVREGMVATFTPDTMGAGESFQGRIGPMIPTYDSQTRALELTAILDNTHRQLLPGMFGKVEVVLGVKDHALTVPEEAIIQEQGRQGVFVVGRSGIAKFTPVTVGLSSAGQVEILTGLNAGDQVVVIGQNRLRDGQEVQLLGEGSGSRQGGERQGGKHRGERREARRKGGDGR